MKSYEERVDLIDKAIEQYGGVFPKEEFPDTSPKIVIHCYDDTGLLDGMGEKGQIDDFGFGADALDKEHWGIVCDEQEFNRRLAETSSSLEWDGEGYPPIGSVVEYANMYYDDVWRKGTIKYVGDLYIIINTDIGEVACTINSVKFRAVKSKQQLLIDAMNEDIDNIPFQEDTAETLVGLGWTKEL